MSALPGDLGRTVSDRIRHDVQIKTPSELVSLDQHKHSAVPCDSATQAKMGEPSWQETLRLRLVERNARESSYAPIIEQCTSTLLVYRLATSGYATILIALAGR